jgi:hypothetical protein
MVKLGTEEIHCDHEVELHGAWPVRGDGAPSIIERKDEEFIPALLEELTGENPSSVVPTHRPSSTSGNSLRLYQPVHRAFNLALLEAHCTTFGEPRLDPRKIDSSGLVVRRVRIQNDGTKRYEAWCATKNVVSGWTLLPDVADSDHLRDPDPSRRPQTRYTADPAFDRLKFGAGDRTAEETTSLFVAPPETAASTSRTLLYGVIPVTSSSRAGAMPKGSTPDPSEWAKHLSLLLRASNNTASLWPANNATQRAEKLARADLKTPILLPDEAINPVATRFVLLVRQLSQEFSLLRPINPATGEKLLTKLNALTVTLVDGSTRAAGTYLKAAALFYFDHPDNPTPAPTVPRPQTWPAVTDTQATAIFNVLQEIAGETELSVFAGANAGGRYDDTTARYVIRAFIRVKQPCDCPPKIVWSPYSEEFAIAPWYESGPGGPVPIILPDLTPDFFKNARPNVAFSVPAKLANVLNQDPKKFFDGSAGQGSGFTLDWICGFNIPIITICAFIVLNIMLGLLNIIFFWLPFVKICIPFPRKK